MILVISLVWKVFIIVVRHLLTHCIHNTHVHVEVILDEYICIPIV